MGVNHGVNGAAAGVWAFCVTCSCPLTTMATDEEKGLLRGHEAVLSSDGEAPPAVGAFQRLGPHPPQAEGPQESDSMSWACIWEEIV